MRADQFLPEEVNQGVINGVLVRKGTVGAFLANARVWGEPSTSAADRAVVERDMIDALPALRAIGLFDVFEIRDAALRALVDAA